MEPLARGASAQPDPAQEDQSLPEPLHEPARQVYGGAGDGRAIDCVACAVAGAVPAADCTGPAPIPGRGRARGTCSGKRGLNISSEKISTVGPWYRLHLQTRMDCAVIHGSVERGRQASSAPAGRSAKHRTTTEEMNVARRPRDTKGETATTTVGEESSIRT